MDGFRVLVSVVEAGGLQSLTTMVLTANKIKHEGASELARALRVRGTLKCLTLLDLCQNPIGAVGQQNLLEAMVSRDDLPPGVLRM